jgi:hypothetical protein
MFGFFRRLPGMGRLLRTVGIAGVPAGGYFGAGWPLSTLLLVYWLETVLLTAVIAALIVGHRRRTRKAGHWNVPYTSKITVNGVTTTRSGSTTFLVQFLGVMVPFTLVHGVFVLIFAFLVFPEQIGPEAAISIEALRLGMLGIAIFLLAGFLFDLNGLGNRPFRWVERMAQRAQGRMLITHLTILFGMGALMVFEAPLAFFALFVGFKLLFDLAGLLPDRDPIPGKPSRLIRAFDRLLPAKDGEGFAAEVEKQIAEQLAHQEANEQVLEPGQAPG